MRRAARLAWLCSACVACGGPELPDGVECTGDLWLAADSAALSAALAAALSGDCVVLTGSSYAGPVRVETAALTLTAAAAGAPELSGGGEAVLTLAGADIRLHGLRISGATRHGLRIAEGGVRVESTQVSGGPGAGVGIKCEDRGCISPAPVLLAAVEISGFSSGLFVDGRAVRLEGGRVVSSQSSGLAGGAGIYALHGAQLDLQDTRLENNTYGLVASDPGTVARLAGALVVDNSDGGVWAQNLAGSAGAPALSVHDSELSGNGVLGLGALATVGIEVIGSNIHDTQKRPVQLGLGMPVDIGDGLGFFMGTAEAAVETTRLVDNQRAQGVLDAVAAGVRFEASNSVSGGDAKIVIQNGSLAVQVPSGDVSIVPALLVRASPFTVPSL